MTHATPEEMLSAPGALLPVRRPHHEKGTSFLVPCRPTG